MVKSERSREFREYPVCREGPLMATDTSWEPFGIPDEEYDQAPARSGTRVLNLSLRRPAGDKERDRAAAWLRNAMIGLGALAAAAAVVSFTAQYRMVFDAKHLAAIAA